MENSKWEIKIFNSQIADTGDYDGYYMLTNGDIELITRDEIDTDDPDDNTIQTLVNNLNTLGIKWENPKVDELTYELYLEKENCNKWKEMCERLYRINTEK